MHDAGVLNATRVYKVRRVRIKYAVYALLAFRTYH